MKKIFYILILCLLGFTTSFCMKNQQGKEINADKIQEIIRFCNDFKEKHKHINKDCFITLCTEALTKAGYSAYEIKQAYQYLQYSNNKILSAKSLVKSNPFEAMKMLEELANNHNDYETQYSLSLLYYQLGCQLDTSYFEKSKNFVTKALENVIQTNNHQNE